MRLGRLDLLELQGLLARRVLRGRKVCKARRDQRAHKALRALALR